MAYNVAAVISTAVVFPLVGILTIGLRFWMRLSLRPSYVGVDDWLVLVAGILVCGIGACYISSAVLGTSGRDYLTPADPSYEQRNYTSTKISYAILVIEKPTYGLIKLSVLFFFRRIFKTNRPFKIANNILILLITAWTLAFFLSGIFTCGAHPSLYWTDNKLCVKRGIANPSAQLFWFGITDIISDAAILVLPYPVIKVLQKPAKEKIGIACIFALGWLSTIAGITRMVYVAKAGTIDTRARLMGQPTPIYSPPGFWTQAEISIGIIAANLPSLGPLLRELPEHASLKSLISRRKSSVTAHFDVSRKENSLVGVEGERD